MSLARSWSPLLILAFAGAACHTRPPALSPTVPRQPAAAAPARPPVPPPPPRLAAATPRAAAPLTEADLFSRLSLDDLNGEHPLGDAFFDYDQSELRDDARRALQQDAQWLAKWPQTMIRVDGHADERGTAEYNLALSEKRAAAVKDYLTDLGVRSERIATRGLGKDAPFCQDESESCWSQNRRGHFIVTAK